ncbi:MULTISPECIES: hypothetical protein [Bradyrhizobium]|uniref:hypothetical protein n=1 Tax=Bradyrhizobium TaxID=374 RepID=UPI00039F4FEC|nr:MULTISPECIES: hypothetical protein [Bradyrhizobium]MCL8484697.1 hypothetical protein [Bradyrhizobium denitrificans]RTM03170.1 MAG: hypothetical protein EKK32_08870 [Bradyrhizobiaceae bacterium]
MLEITDMQAHRVPPQQRLSVTPRAALAVGIAILFLLLHVVAGVIVRASATVDGPSSVSMRQIYD